MMIRIREYSGGHAEVGRAHGEDLRAEFRAELDARLERCVGASRSAGAELAPAEIMAIVRSHLPHVRDFSPGLHQELLGIASGAGAAPEDALLVSGYTDIVDVVSRTARERGGPARDANRGDIGCTALYVSPAASATGRAFVAQTWDMYSGAEDNVFALRIRVPGEPEVLALSYPGCVGMMGMNAAGVALTGNNLVSLDAQSGVPWTLICRGILAARSTAQALALFSRVRLCSGHNFLFADGSGNEACSVETCGTRWARLETAGPTFVHTNHCLHPDTAKFEKPFANPRASTYVRLERMRAILAEGRGRIDRAFLEAALADHAGAPLALCRHRETNAQGGSVSTCAGIVMEPAARELRAVQGNPCSGGWATVKL